MSGFNTADDREVLVIANVYHWATTGCDMTNCVGVVWCCHADGLDKDGFQAIHEYLQKRDAREAELALQVIISGFGPEVTIE
jgi:hypothetical protein